MRNLWWAYLHSNGNIIVKRYLEHSDIHDAKVSPFVSRILTTFSAKDRSDAVEIAKKCFEKGKCQMTTDLRDKTVYELLEDFTRYQSVNDPEYKYVSELARRLREAEQQIAERDAMLVSCYAAINGINEAEQRRVMSSDDRRDYAGTEVNTLCEEALINLPTTAKANAKILRAAQAEARYLESVLNLKIELAPVQMKLVEAVRAAKETK